MSKPPSAPHLPLSLCRRCEPCEPGHYADGVLIVNCIPCRVTYHFVTSRGISFPILTHPTFLTPSGGPLHQRFWQCGVHGVPAPLHDRSRRGDDMQ